MGITTPGNNTVFLKGNIGNILGSSSAFIISSSSGDKSGINSVSASITPVNSNISDSIISFYYSFVKSICQYVF